MMKISKWFMAGMAMTLCIVLMTACKPKSETTSTSEQMEAPAKAKVDIAFATTPEKPNPNIVPTLQTTVKQNGKAITDARVDLEVWKEGMTTHQMTTATHTKDGVYSADSPIKEAGDYKVIVHVTTKDGLEQTSESTYKVEKKGKCCEGNGKEESVKKKKKCCEGH